MRALLLLAFTGCDTPAERDDGGSALCNVDADGDGFGTTTTVAASSCTDEGVADNADDCDDNAASIHPGGTETAADGIDQDCDGNDVCFEDLDDDGYGAVRRLAADCAAAGLVGPDGDCNDSNAAVHPGADEIALDAIDQDCDGGDACDSDSDGDGFGTSIPTASADTDCTDEGEADDTDDCLDVGESAAATFPGAAELESIIDCMTDADGDGYGSWAPAEGVTPGRDCDDADTDPCPVIHVGYADEFPNPVNPGAGYLMGCRIYVNSSMTVTDLAVIGKAASGNVRMALYTDLSAMPDALLIEVPSTPMVDGALEMPVDLTPIDRGYYWLMANYDDWNALVGGKGSSSDDCMYAPYEFRDSMPDPFVTPYPAKGWIFNYYIVGWE
jgi:hypothetical protein